MSHSGVFRKRGALNTKSWTVRKYILKENSCLEYYEPNTNKKKGEILLESCEFAVGRKENIIESGCTNQQAMALNIKCKDRIFELVFDFIKNAESFVVAVAKKECSVKNIKAFMNLMKWTTDHSKIIPMTFADTTAAVKSNLAVQPRTHRSTTPTPFYLNILLLNSAQVLEQKVQSRLGHNVLANAVAFAVQNLLTDEGLIERISYAIVDKLESATASIGITAQFKKVYTNGPYMVIKTSILAIDKMLLINAAKGPEFGGKFHEVLSCLDYLGLDEAFSKIEENLLGKVNSALMLKFAEVIPLKLKAQNILVDIHTCTSSDQAEFFFMRQQHLSEQINLMNSAAEQIDGGCFSFCVLS